MDRDQLQDIVTMVEKADEALKPARETLAQFQKTVAPVLAKGVVAGFKAAQNAAQRVEAWRERHLTEQFYFKVMFQLGWPPPLRLSEGEITEILDVILVPQDDEALKKWDPSEETQATVNDIITDAYNAPTLNRMYEQWEDHPAVGEPEARILSDVVQAHNDGSYTLSVPAIPPRLEGLLAKAFKHEGWIRTDDVQSYLEQLFSSQNFRCGQELRNFVGENYLANFSHGEPVSSSLSRHAILHGGDPHYATEANSLRALILFSLAVTATTFIADEDDDLFHVYSCSEAVKIPTDRRKFFANPGSLLPEQRELCPVCVPEESDNIDPPSNDRESQG